jgi:hypothetical protein
MRELRSVFALVLALALSAPVLAADLQAGLEAFNRGDYATALEELRPLAEQGDAGAQLHLGIMYAGVPGIPQDYAEAVKWYRLAAEQGDASAQYTLGIMYALGEGVPQDYAEVVKWYRLAAEQGDAFAQLELGIMYADGEGVAQDYVLSDMWFSLAAAHLPADVIDVIEETAATQRYIIEKRMTPAQVAEAQRLAREWKPK